MAHADRAPHLPSDHPLTWAVQLVGDGDYVIVDCFDELRAPPFSTAKQAMEWLAAAVNDYEPKETGDAWSGGFAENH